MKKAIIITLAALTASACSSTSQQSLQQQYSNYLDITPEYNEDSASKSNAYWKLEKQSLRPQFPLTAAQSGKTGCVVLDIAINEDGKTEGYQIVDSFPAKVFDKSAIRSVKTWQWQASLQNTKKQQVISRVKIDYKLNNATTNKELAADPRAASICKRKDMLVAKK
ncbi:MAG: energy transducer TonB [Psychrobium sp.]